MNNYPENRGAKLKIVFDKPRKNNIHILHLPFQISNLTSHKFFRINSVILVYR
jgi:hypothetical protein